MENKAAVQQAVNDYLASRRMSVAALARAVGELSQATLNRMMTPDVPSYLGEPKSWLRLARYEPLHLDPREVLEAIYLAPEERAQSVEADPISTIARMLRQLGVEADEAAPIMLHVQGAAARARASASRTVASQ